MRLRNVAVAGLATIVAARLPVASSEPYELQRLADGVYALIRHDPEAFANNANSLIVIGDSDVVVVDAQYTRAATNQTIAAIRGLTAKPVRYVINTHWHDDHVAGNQVYRDTFPGVDFVAQENTRRDLATLGAQNRKATRNAAGPYIARLRRLMSAGLGGDSTPIVPLERAALESTIAITDTYMAEAPQFRETLPTITYARMLTLRGGAHPVELRYFGRGNTQGDAVVFLPRERIAAVGDLLVHPVPFAFNSYPSEWIAALDSVRALRPAAIVPGHGPVFRDDAYLRQVQQMLRRVRDDTRAAVATGASLEQVRRAVLLRDLRDSVAHGDKWMNVLFTSFFLGPAIRAAYDEAAGKH